MSGVGVLCSRLDSARLDSASEVMEVMAVMVAAVAHDM